MTTAPDPGQPAAALPAAPRRGRAGLGARIAVGDSGTDRSALAYLAGMPVDLLETDQHVLAGVEFRPAAAVLPAATS